ncbi:uroporphyrinogen-III synthase [Nematostella vectensis]|uniref:uroporphyrinogen-III synthase n=1 Tax=Nematostella vectensis TaxID=45351 RepID=UPI00138FDBC5|nr:uroporphyrinogen-III synthase [Nematostella vectensis]
MATECPSVLLLRSSSDDPKQDRYHMELRSHGFQCTSIPVLSFEFENLDKLEKMLSEPTEYGGIILTSARGVEAMEKCIEEKISLSVWQESFQFLWQRLPVFVVGPATSQAAKKKLGLESVGHQAGSAEMLAPMILEGAHPQTKPFLFPCGNLRKETIPTEMQNAGVPLKGLQVYKTCKHTELAQNLTSHVEEKGVPSVIVFFSPSGVQFVLSLLTEIFGDFSALKLVAIGATTSAAMIKHGLSVAAVAKQPSPKSLAECISQCF